MIVICFKLIIIKLLFNAKLTMVHTLVKNNLFTLTDKLSCSIFSLFFYLLCTLLDWLNCPKLCLILVSRAAFQEALKNISPAFRFLLMFCFTHKHKISIYISVNFR